MNSRLEKVKKLLQTKRLDALLISSVPNIFYLTGYAGFSPLEREAFLLVTNEGQFLLTDLRYSEAVKIHVPHFSLLEITADIPFTKHMETLMQTKNIKAIGYEDDDLKVAEYNKISRPDVELTACNLSELRMIKNAEEISSINRACAIGDNAFSNMLKQIKTGVTEKQLAIALEMFIKRQGADLSFPPIIAFGANAATPHHHTSEAKLKKNNFVLLDFGVKYNNYCSDMTRTVFLGKATKEQKRIYQTVLEAQQKVTEYLNSVISRNKVTRDPIGISRFARNDKRLEPINASDVDEVARSHIISQGYPSIPHSLGHGIGIEVHEAPTLSPKSKQELTDGMVFSIEPGVYLPGRGGVRIEDLFIIQKNKLIQLTQSPTHFIEL